MINLFIESIKDRLAKISAFFVSWASKMTYASTGAAFGFSFDANTIGVSVSVLIAILTFWTNSVSKKKAEERHARNEALGVESLMETRRLEKEEHDLKMDVLRKQLDGGK